MSATAVAGDCIEWTALRMKSGYGRKYIPAAERGPGDLKLVYAHRAAWEDAKGPIPKGMQIHHACENKACVNVDHLRVVDQREHHGAAGHGKLTQGLADEIRGLVAVGWMSCDVADAYNVSRQQVCAVVKGRSWA